MKKALVIVLTLVLALSVVAFAACSGTTYEGEYKYENPYAKGSYYGAKVQVTVQGNVITKVVLLSDAETGWTNLSPNWTDKSNSSAWGDIPIEQGKDDPGKTNWRYHHQEFLDSFVGVKVEDVLAMKVFVTTGGEPYTKDGVETIKYVPIELNDTIIVTGHGEYTAGATQSSGRTILAIQNALKKAVGAEDTTPNYETIEKAEDGSINVVK